MAANGSEFVTLSQLKTSIDSIDTSSSSIDAYPVGSIYMSTKSTSPASLFGGTWQQIKDRFLIAAGSTYKAGGTGGEATHTLRVDEMPSHSHDVSMTTRSMPIEHALPKYNLGTASFDGYTATLNYEATFTGGGSAHNNMPPYLSVYTWKRTA